MTPADSPFRNRLADETSPYLLQHAGNPVDWHPWGEEALSLAQTLDRPILLSIADNQGSAFRFSSRKRFQRGAESARFRRENQYNGRTRGSSHGIA